MKVLRQFREDMLIYPVGIGHFYPNGMSYYPPLLKKYKEKSG